MKLHFIIILVLCHKVCCTETSENVNVYNAETDNNQPHEEIDNSNNNDNVQESISDLVSKQTETIKKLIAEHSPSIQLDRYEILHKDHVSLKKESEKNSIEELKRKCEELNKSNTPVYTAEIPQATMESYGPLMRPNFLRFKPKFPPPPPNNVNKIPQMSGNYFIFTQNPNIYGHRYNVDKMEAAASSIEEEEVSAESEENAEELEIETTTIPITTTTTAIPTTAASPPAMQMKYVRLEPIVPQKTLLTNGQTVIYWYRLLPATQSFVQIPNTAENENVNMVAQPQNMNLNIPLPEQYKYYLDPQTGMIASNNKPNIPTTPTTTSTMRPMEDVTKPSPIYPRPQFFINPQTGMIYQSALPHQFIYHKRTPSASQVSTQNFELLTATSTTSTTTTTEEPKIPMPTYSVEFPHEEEKPEESKYKHEFRFVLPMALPQSADLSNYPNQFDPYAYLPKNQQPSMMNIPVPYKPNYQMIRTLTIPKPKQK